MFPFAKKYGSPMGATAADPLHMKNTRIKPRENVAETQHINNTFLTVICQQIIAFFFVEKLAFLKVFVRFSGLLARKGTSMGFCEKETFVRGGERENRCEQQAVHSGVAEMKGFEPLHGVTRLPHFECGPFNHLGTSPLPKHYATDPLRLQEGSA